MKEVIRTSYIDFIRDKLEIKFEGEDWWWKFGIDGWTEWHLTNINYESDKYIIEYGVKNG